MSKVDEKDELTNQELMNSEQIIIDWTPDITDMPNYASISQFGGDVNIMEGENNGGVVGMVLHDNVIYERSQDINDEAIYAQHQGLTRNNDGLAPGSTVERKEWL